MSTATLLFNAQGIKAVKLDNETETIQVWYVDGNEPITIYKDDEMYEHSLISYTASKEEALAKQAAELA